MRSWTSQLIEGDAGMRQFDEIKEILRSYPMLQAQVKNIELNIKDLEQDESIGIASHGLMEYTGRTYKINDSTGEEAAKRVDLIKQYEWEKDRLQRIIDRIDNALSILSDTEFQIIKMRYLDPNKNTWTTIADHVGYSEKWAKQYEHDALAKIAPFFSKRINRQAPLPDRQICAL